MSALQLSPPPSLALQRETRLKTVIKPMSAPTSDQTHYRSHDPDGDSSVTQPGNRPPSAQGPSSYSDMNVIAGEHGRSNRNDTRSKIEERRIRSSWNPDYKHAALSIPSGLSPEDYYRISLLPGTSYARGQLRARQSVASPDLGERNTLYEGSTPPSGQVSDCPAESAEASAFLLRTRGYTSGPAPALVKAASTDRRMQDFEQWQERQVPPFSISRGSDMTTADPRLYNPSTATPNTYNMSQAELKNLLGHNLDLPNPERGPE